MRSSDRETTASKYLSEKSIYLTFRSFLIPKNILFPLRSSYLFGSYFLYKFLVSFFVSLSMIILSPCHVDKSILTQLV